MAVVHSPAIKPHQHVAGREHEDAHRHEHEDDGVRLSVVAERLIEGPLNMHVPPHFIIAIAPSKHNSVHLLLVQFRWQKDAFLFDADKDRRDITVKDLAVSF